LDAMRQILLVITTQPSCANATRIITTSHNFYACVRLLLDEQFYSSDRIVRAAILDQGNQRAYAATSAAEFDQHKVELKQDDITGNESKQDKPKIWSAHFR